MNRVIASLLILFAVVIAVNAKDIKESQVPAKVKAYVTNNYPKASHKEWEYKNKNNHIYYYRVEFKVDGREVKLELSTDGTLISSREELADADIPLFIKEYIQKNYSDTILLGVRKETQKGSTHYDAGIQFKTSQGYTRHRNIYFDTEGNVIKK